MMQDPNVLWLTQTQFDALQSELEELEGPGRAAIVARVSEARDEGDLKENSGYHAAREELSKIDGRIAQIKDMLKRARVGETPPDDGIVEPGMVVTIRFAGDDDTETFLLGARETMAEGEDIQVYSPQSPLGAALLGNSSGSTVSYQAPSGSEIKVEIVKAVPYQAE